MNDKAIWTNKSILLWTTEYFSKHDVSSPRLNAETLLSMVTGLERFKLYTCWDKPLHPKELEEFRTLIKRRVAGEPLQYICGRQDFWTLTLEVNQDVLIPRQDSESLIEEVLNLFDKDRSLNILDLCTGSGNLALSLAYEYKAANILATDISQRSVDVAKRNAVLNNLENRVEFGVGDLFDVSILAPYRSLFDLIISNPPYIPLDAVKELDSEVRLFEPPGALDGGDDGKKFYRKILAESPKYLKKGGILLFEIGAEQAADVCELFEDNAFLGITVKKDYCGNDRVIYGKL